MPQCYIFFQRAELVNLYSFTCSSVAGNLCVFISLKSSKKILWLRIEIVGLNGGASMSKWKMSDAMLPEPRTRLPRKKSPVIAAILGFVLGPIGYLYIGWKYAVMSIVVYAIFMFVLMVADFDPVSMPAIRPWIRFPLMIVYAWKAYAICRVRNTLIDSKDELSISFNSFPLAALAMTDLMIGLAMFYAGSIGLFVSVHLFLNAQVIKGVLMLLVGTPALVWISSIVFGFVAGLIDLLFVRGIDNIFRKDHRY
jgi:hypothetical protein